MSKHAKTKTIEGLLPQLFAAGTQVPISQVPAGTLVIYREAQPLAPGEPDLYMVFGVYQHTAGHTKCVSYYDVDRYDDAYRLKPKDMVVVLSPVSATKEA